VPNDSLNFLLMGLGFSLNGALGRERTVRRPPRFLSTVHGCRAELRPVLFLRTRERVRRDIWHWAGYGRLLLVVHKGPGAEAAAKRISEAVQALISLDHGWPVEHNLQPYRIPREILRGDRIFESDFERANQSEPPYAHPLIDGLRARALSSVTFSEGSLAEVFFYLPTVFAKQELFDALLFYQEAVSDYIFQGDSITEVLSEPDSVPDTDKVRVQLESSLLSSFRVIEALVGEPGQNLERFHDRLRRIGVDAEEPVGFPGDEPKPMTERVRFVHQLRDATSAHGRRRRRAPLKYKEVMEAQHLAQAVVQRALFHFTSEQGRMDGKASERKYLLAAMFGASSMRNARSALGVRPEALVTRPGGLVQIWNAIQGKRDD
jgi:hypothetical protein